MAGWTKDLTAANPNDHSARHEDGGTDEISVAGLSGLLADDQHVLDSEVTAVAIAKAIIDAKGDLITGSAADTPVILSVGTNGRVLIADSGQSGGLRWGILYHNGLIDGGIIGAMSEAMDSLDTTFDGGTF